MSGMSTIKGGEYILATGVEVIVNDNTNNTNNKSNKVMVSVGSSNSIGNNSKDTTTWLVSNLVDFVSDLGLYSGNGVLSGRQHLDLGSSCDKEYVHRIDGVNSTHKIETHTSTVQ